MLSIQTAFKLDPVGGEIKSILKLAHACHMSSLYAFPK